MDLKRADLIMSTDRARCALMMTPIDQLLHWRRQKNIIQSLLIAIDSIVPDLTLMIHRRKLRTAHGSWVGAAVLEVCSMAVFGQICSAHVSIGRTQSDSN